jgi:hypothetical protein
VRKIALAQDVAEVLIKTFNLPADLSNLARIELVVEGSSVPMIKLSYFLNSNTISTGHKTFVVTEIGEMNANSPE